MNVAELHNKTAKIESEYKKLVAPLEEECKQFEGLHVVIPYGEYKGRLGKVGRVQLLEGKVLALIQPFRLRGDCTGDNGTLTDTCDARTLWRLFDVDRIVCHNSQGFSISIRMGEKQA